MSKTNTAVQEAFGQGKAARNGKGTLISDTAKEDGFAFLLSYGTTIAIRRAQNEETFEETFRDAHSYSPTTSQHQGGHYGDNPTFSFSCVEELMGPRWFMTARIIDWGPKDCTDPACGRERDQQWAMYRAGITDWYDDIMNRCWATEEERMRIPNQHTIELPEYDDKPGRWKAPAVLLEFNRSGQHTYVLCGFEHGKTAQYAGRTDQLWAAILPFRPMNIKMAFEALKPSYVRNAERGNALATDAGQPGVAIRRQGDLYFVSCPNGQGPPKDAIKMDGVSLPPGDRANHRPNQVRMTCGPAMRHGYAAMPPGGDEWLFWAKGNVDHPEHTRLRLGSWHRVLRSAAVQGASAAYRNYQGSGSAACGD